MTNEEKILELLEAQGKILEAHSKMLGGLKQDVAEIRLNIENRIDPQLQALAEGQKTILEALTPNSRVEALEEELVVIKEAFRSLSQEIAELKKAQ